MLHLIDVIIIQGLLWAVPYLSVHKTLLFLEEVFIKNHAFLCAYNVIMFPHFDLIHVLHLIDVKVIQKLLLVHNYRGRSLTVHAMRLHVLFISSS